MGLVYNVISSYPSGKRCSFQRRLHRRHQPSTTVYPNYSHNDAWATSALQDILPKETIGCATMNIKLVLSAAFAVVAYFLGIIADANHNTDSVIYPAACFSKIFLFLAAIPLANSAGKSIRKQLGTTGIPGLRLTSWILYGVAIVHFAFFFMWPTIASGNAQLPDGQITVDATIFLMASMFMIADAWNSSKSKV